MKIVPLPQLRVEDYPKEEQKWLPQLFGALNQFLTSVTNALQNNVTFSDNVLGQEQDITFTWASASSSLPLKFRASLSGAPVSLVVCQATEGGTPVILNVAWHYLNGQVLISDIAKTASGVTGSLVSGTKYFLRVRIET